MTSSRAPCAPSESTAFCSASRTPLSLSFCSSKSAARRAWNGQRPIGRWAHCLHDLYACLTAEQWHVRTRANEEIYKSLAQAVRTGNARLSGHFRGLVSNPVLSLEFAPLLNRIISPPIRPVA